MFITRYRPALRHVDVATECGVRPQPCAHAHVRPRTHGRGRGGGGACEDVAASSWVVAHATRSLLFGCVRKFFSRRIEAFEFYSHHRLLCV
jgi:hypothetical protein